MQPADLEKAGLYDTEYLPWWYRYGSRGDRGGVTPVGKLTGDGSRGEFIVCGQEREDQGFR